jgi:hypothetical protein
MFSNRAAQLIASMIVVAATAPAADAANYILHFQGRSQQTWKTDASGTRMVLADTSGTTWVNKTFTFNGNARLASTETDSTTNTNSVNYAIRTYCGTGTGNTCVIHAYSTGCARTAKAIDDIRNGVGGTANTLSGLLYIEGSGCADGGTDLAELSTGKFTGWLSKLLGQQEAVDKDLTRAAMRTTYSYIHDQIGVNYWRVDGGADICKKMVGILKICASSYIAGNDDGVVPWASSGGFSASTARTSLCSVSAADEQDTSKNVSGKWPFHRTDTYYISCNGTSLADGATWDHFGVPDVVEAIIAADIHNGTASYQHWAWGDATTETACTSASTCDNAFANTNNNDFGTTYADGYATGATGVDAYTSQSYGTTGSTTSCAARCGTNPGGSYCSCDAASATKCGDYTAQHCNYVNQ